MANNIKQIRKSLGISVTELATRLKMSQGNLTKIENGQVDLKFETAQAIASALSCPIDRIFSEEKTEISPLILNFNLPTESQNLTIRDDTMFPTLRKGDIAIISPLINKQDDGLYVIIYQNKKRVRRLQTLGNGALALICDNRAYETEYVEKEEIEIIGKVTHKISISEL